MTAARNNLRMGNKYGIILLPPKGNMMNSEEIKRLVSRSENVAVEFKRGRGGVPADFWPSYSAKER